MARLLRRFLLLIAIAIGGCLPALASAQTDTVPAEMPWATSDAEGQPAIHLYALLSETCPHCRRARPWLDRLWMDLPFVRVHNLYVNNSRQNQERFGQLALRTRSEIQGVPAFFFCNTMITGYDDAGIQADRIMAGLTACHAELVQLTAPATAPATTAAGPAPASEAVPTAPSATEPVEQSTQTATPTATAAAPATDTTAAVPLVGRVDFASWSLPMTTVVLGGLDAFNPCAFFVLLFLMSLLVHTKSRARMMLIGGVFVVVSGVVYFLFMAAWLNIFLLIGSMSLVTMGAGLVALVVAALNIKDFVATGVGPSLAIPDQAKPDLFGRMRGLLKADNTAVMVTGAVALAVFANLYELLCTAGFPMVYTRILTLNELTPAGYYVYLALYNVVYVLPLAAIVTVFVWTMGQRRLGENEGRLLKLMSGLMMLGLGLVLVLDPTLLDNMATAAGLIATAVIGTLVAGAVINLPRRTPA